MNGTLLDGLEALLSITGLMKQAYRGAPLVGPPHYQTD